MIAWVDEQCRSWGVHKCWLEGADPQGWPARSILGRLIEEGPGASHGTFGSIVLARDDPPAYRAVTLSLRRMADTHEMGTPCRVVHAHYLYNGKAKQKAPQLGLSVRQYWQHLHAAHAFISACPYFDVPRGAQVCAQNFQAA